MSHHAPDEAEIRDHLLELLDDLAETRTEDRHPAPEFRVALHAEGYTIHGIDPDAFADEFFAVWERFNVNEQNATRFAADEECTPRLIQSTIENVAEQALDDAAYLIRRHLIQPAPLALAG